MVGKGESLFSIYRSGHGVGFSLSILQMQCWAPVSIVNGGRSGVPVFDCSPNAEKQP